MEQKLDEAGKEKLLNLTQYISKEIKALFNRKVTPDDFITISYTESEGEIRMNIKLAKDRKGYSVIGKK